MFTVGDYLVKSVDGLCQVRDIMTLEDMGMDKDKLYYLLVPVADEKMQIYASIDYDPESLRKALTKEEAGALINRIPGIDELEIENDKQREREYKKAVRSCEPEMWVSVIKTIYLREQKRLEQGKKSTALDEQYFRRAEDYLYSELAHALNKNKAEIGDYITKSIEKKV